MVIIANGVCVYVCTDFGSADGVSVLLLLDKPSSCVAMMSLMLVSAAT